MELPGWFLDERAHAGHEHGEPDYVATYDRKAGTDPAADVDLLVRLGLNATHTVVDLGAGTGTFALEVAKHCRRVVAVDVSTTMLAQLRRRAEQAGCENIECVQAGFVSYEHQGAPVDFVYTRHALHHLPDFWKALALERIASIMSPTGVLCLRDIVFSFEPAEAETAIAGWLQTAAAQPEFGWTHPELEEHLREEHSTFSWLLEPMLLRAGFEIRDAWYSDSKIYALYCCVRNSGQA